jgi:hypothetical protein
MKEWQKYRNMSRENRDVARKEVRGEGDGDNDAEDVACSCSDIFAASVELHGGLC